MKLFTEHDFGEYKSTMNFNPDPNKQAHEVIFNRKAKEINHPPLVFNNI